MLNLFNVSCMSDWSLYQHKYQSHNKMNGFSQTEKINIAGSIQKKCADVALGKRQMLIAFLSLTDFYKSRNKFHLTS